MYTTEEVEQLCERYAANERGDFQRRLDHSEQQLAASRQRVAELEKMMKETIDKLAATEIEIAQMSRELATLRLRVPAGGQQAVQQHPRAPTQNFANLPPRPPPAASRQPEMQQRGHGLNLGAAPFLPTRPALPAPSPPRQTQQQGMVVAPRNPPPPPPAPKAMREGVRTPQRLLPGTPGHADDVFDPSVPDRLPWRPADFGKSPLSDLLRSAFDRVMRMVNSQGFVQIPQSQIAGGRDFIGLCIKHVDKARMAYEMLNDRDRYPRLVTGVILRMMVDKIFVSKLLLSFPADNDGTVANLITRHQAESEIVYPDPVVNDFNRRRIIAENRAEAATNVQRLPRFWRWVDETSRLIAEDILPQVDVTVTAERRDYKELLVMIANELLRIHIRMMQEPSLYSIEFVGTGYAWVGERMLNRDPILMAQPMMDERSPWVTQCTITPLVTETRFERTAGSDRTMLTKETLLKAAVTLCARRGNLRQ